VRLTSELFVSALLRRVAVDGGYGAVLRRGSSEAGAILVVLRGRGTVALMRPAPQSAYDGARPEDRLFIADIAADDAAIDAAIAREARFDPDLWVVELETPTGAATPYLTVTTP